MAKLHERKATGSEKKAIKKAKASGNGFAEAKVEQESTAVPIETFPDLQDVMDEYCHEYREIAEHMRILEERRKELSDVIMQLVLESRVDSIVGDNYHVVKVTQTRRPLSETKLVELGVDPDVIAAAKGEVVTTYLQVRAFIPGE